MHYVSLVCSRSRACASFFLDMFMFTLTLFTLPPLDTLGGSRCCRPWVCFFFPIEAAERADGL